MLNKIKKIVGICIILLIITIGIYGVFRVLPNKDKETEQNQNHCINM